MKTNNNIQLSILHLEDDENDALLIRRYLMNLYPNAFLHWVSNKEDFVEALGGIPFDIILADYNVPGFPGFMLCNLIEEDYPHITLFFVTGTLEDENLAKETLIHEASGFVLKNSLPKLEGLLQHYIQGNITKDRNQRIQLRVSHSQQMLEKIRMKYFPNSM